MGKEIEMLLQQSLRFTNIMTLINIRTTGPFQIPEKLLKEVVSKAPEEERVKTTYTLVDKLESIITKSRNYAKSHRRTTQRNSRDYFSLLEKHYDKFVLMIQDPTKAEQLGQKVEEVPQRTTPLKRKGGVKGRPTSASR
ncbi:hypothetical protein BASA62_010270 [Batrachochytrium salamandrivorans]|nr:hypothetical protein BASA62_010270 [Batrachochytrium salamandrivorans]